MHLSRFTLSNYKCFNQPVELILKPGVNLVVGKNNSGKSALLQAMTIPGSTNASLAHRSFGENGEAFGTGSGDGELVFALTTSELAALPKPAVSQRPAASVPAVPLPTANTAFARMVQYEGQDEQSLLHFSKWFQAATLEVSMSVSGGNVRLSADGGYSSIGTQPSWWELSHALAGKTKEGLIGPQPAYLTNVGAALKGRLRFVPAVRANSLTAALGTKTDRLAADGSNTVALLGSIQENRHRMDRFIRLVEEVLPEVKHLSVRKHARNTNQGDVAIWEHAPETERDDLAPSLDQSGTGVRHILILLLTVFDEKEPLVILIDEFEHSLHPGAIRELLEIFGASFPQHQFVIGTHSPTAIASGRLATVSVVTKTDGQSTVRSIDSVEFQRRKQLLAEVGASVSDLFGADAVLWVEGRTEETCFPRIFEKLAKAEQFGAAVIKGLLHTGDLEGRDANRLIQIYEKLSGADALFPPAIGFILDGETRSPQKKDDLKRRSDRIRFLPRRMFENYLLHPVAIAAVLSAVDGSPGPVSASAVEDWLRMRREKDAAGADWETTVHAGKLLKDLFAELSGQTVEYRKPEHSAAIAEWLLENEPTVLQEIANLVHEAMQERGSAA